MKLLLDTNMLIDFGNRDTKTLKIFEILEEKYELCISVITEMELIIGCRNKNELYKLKQFLSRYKVIVLNESITALSKSLLEEYYLSHGLNIPDSLIAGTVLFYQYIFFTRNLKDFRYIKVLTFLKSNNALIWFSS